MPLAPPVVALQRAHRKTQLEDRMRAANVSQETGYVLPRRGRRIEPRNLLRVLQGAASRIGVAGVRVHTLRHSHASAALEAGVGLKTVSELLGHSSITITGDVYAYVSDAAAQAAVDTVAANLGV